MLKKNFDEKKASRITFTVEENEKIVGTAFLYVLYNETHTEPYGLFGDILVDEAYRGKGYGRELTQAVIEEAKAQNCYKLVATSREVRPEVHAMYERYGLKKYGFEFRMNLK
ncbi:MAG: hypothetical protein A3B90_01985 [Candidatus Magasanikbacteria bacterium RIFCSPHIGHO2_02_FULL_41_13]|uniref:N-acetyltransferase domain-containing protein n=1 Tax=Candidatus Magasanikbacteria bacterium RIFCSPHIGHO2_02_FULL_41_13 TaxID=1798676 RepID=A0A1F6M5R3_9BACT|nr:MAG: hypothetical protein A3B90_01985 [Candidatus Magasanikbacteria bacterium RIFCSPHIGHO2_02_FULL_41_13]